MDESQKPASARKAGDVGAAATLVIAGFAGLKLLDDSSSPTGGDLVAWILWSLAAALLVRTLLTHLW
jgi:hypothetical protein